MQIIIKIQRRFLWGESEQSKKICRVSWDKICLPKKKGGLGVKNIEMFNLSLLAKWRWRFCMDQDAIWRYFLLFRYGFFMERGGADHPCPSFASRWVRDLFSLESSRGNLGLWFSEAMGRKLGGGSRAFLA